MTYTANCTFSKIGTLTKAQKNCMVTTQKLEVYIAKTNLMNATLFTVVCNC